MPEVTLQHQSLKEGIFDQMYNFNADLKNQEVLKMKLGLIYPNSAKERVSYRYTNLDSRAIFRMDIGF